MIVRRTSFNDVLGIVKCHLSDVNIPDYERLTIEERYRYGGPWMSVETCSIHLNYLFLYRHPVLVAEEDGEIVGEVEALISEEHFLGKIRKICHVEVLMVKESHRRRGIGRRLMEAVEDIARKEGCELITTTPEDRSYKFYKKLGYEDAFEGAIVKIDTEKFHKISGMNVEFSWETVRRLKMVAGMFQSSYHHWFTSFVDIIAGIDKIISSGIVGSSYYVLRELPSGSGGLYVWGSKEDIPKALGIAKGNFKTVITVLNRKMAEKYGDIIGKNVVVAKNLNG